MSNIIGTCGHILDSKWCYSGKADVSVKTHTRDYHPAVSYETVCPICKEKYEKEGKILKTKYDREMWRSSKERERLRKRKEKK